MLIVNPVCVRRQGSLPAAWGNKTQLQAIWLGGNARLNGSIPASWAAAGALRFLQLRATAVGGAVPGVAGQAWPALRYADLDHTRLEAGPVPAALMGAPALEHLSLRGTNRTGRLADLALPAGLIALALADNQVGARRRQRAASGRPGRCLTRVGNRAWAGRWLGYQGGSAASELTGRRLGRRCLAPNPPAPARAGGRRARR